VLSNGVSTGGLIGSLVLGGLGGGLMAIGTTESGTDLSGSGGITLGVGRAMVLGAWLLGEQSRPVMQHGSTTQWTP
jgi:hypothetical protein